MMAISRTSLRSPLAFGLLVGGIAACHSTRAIHPSVSGQPLPRVVPEQARVIYLSGNVYNQQDSTSTVPGVELVVRSQHPDSAGQAWRDLTQADGSYALTLPAGQAYWIDGSKGGQLIAKQSLRASKSSLDTTRIHRDFYIKYVDGCCTEGLAFATYYFDTNSAALRPTSLARIDSFTHRYVAAASEPIILLVEGHAEPAEAPRNYASKPHYLQELAMQRAKSACGYLRKKGIASNRLFLISYGDKRPLAPNTSPEYRQLNRRVAVRLLAPTDIADVKKAMAYEAVLRQAKQGAGPQNATRSWGGSARQACQKNRSIRTVTCSVIQLGIENYLIV